MFVLNEYQILRVIKQYFVYLKDNTAAFYRTFDYIFDELDVPLEDRNVFRDIIANDKIQLRTNFNNLSAEMPNIVCVMDQEIQREKPIGDFIGSDTVDVDDETTEGALSYGVVEEGVYSINIIAKQILLVRLLGTLVRIILEHYSTNQASNITEMTINVDRFSPDADYFPSDTFHVHLQARFNYVASWDEIYGLINQVFLQACENTELEVQNS